MSRLLLALAVFGVAGCGNSTSVTTLVTVVDGMRVSELEVKTGTLYLVRGEGSSHVAVAHVPKEAK